MRRAIRHNAGVTPVKGGGGKGRGLSKRSLRPQCSSEKISARSVGCPIAMSHVRHKWPVSGTLLCSSLAGSCLGVGQCEHLMHPEVQQLEATSQPGS